MLKEVLILTDFSKNAENAVVYGLNLIKDERPIITLLHTVDSSSTNYEAMFSLSEIAAARAETAFSMLKQRIVQLFPTEKFNIRSLILFGDIVLNVQEYLRDREVDLIIMGTKGASDFANLLIGRNALSIVEKISCPILLIPDRCRFSPLTKVLVTVGYPNYNCTYDIELLKMLIKNYQANLHLFYAEKDSTSQTEFTPELPAQLSELHPSVHRVIGKEVLLRITSFIKSQKISLITIVMHDPYFFHRLFHKSIIKTMAVHTVVPLLILKSDSKIYNHSNFN